MGWDRPPMADPDTPYCRMAMAWIDRMDLPAHNGHAASPAGGRHYAHEERRPLRVYMGQYAKSAHRLRDRRRNRVRVRIPERAPSLVRKAYGHDHSNDSERPASCAYSSPHRLGR